MQITTGLRSTLNLPFVYNLLQQILGGPRSTSIIVDRYVRPKANYHILDFGCGPGEIQNYLLPTCSVVGYDISDNYIRHANQIGAVNRKFTTKLEEVESAGPYDVTMAMGLLHHLGDLEAKSCLSFMFRNLKPGGRLVTVDNVYIENQNVIARWMINCDRGKNVRDLESYGLLFREIPDQPNLSIRHDLLRIPYTHVIAELTRTK